MYVGMYVGMYKYIGVLYSAPEKLWIEAKPSHETLINAELHHRAWQTV